MDVLLHFSFFSLRQEVLFLSKATSTKKIFDSKNFFPGDEQVAAAFPAAASSAGSASETAILYLIDSSCSASFSNRYFSLPLVSFTLNLRLD